MIPCTWPSLTPSVLAYFDGERREMLSILGASAAMAMLVVLLYLFSRDGFAKGLMITVLASAALLSATAAVLLSRDPKLSEKLVVDLQSDTAPEAARQEQGRIAAVVANYPRYRWAAAAIGLAALLMLSLSRQPWLHGVAAGLLLLVVAQTVIDRYSERRAATYLNQILSMTCPR